MNKVADGKEHLSLIDIIKGVAIILVVFAHCIQCGSGDDYYKNVLFFDNWIYRLIYSFHMPLLMIISGFLFGISVQKYTASQILIKKVKSILLPIAVWNLIILIRHVLAYGVYEWIKIYLYSCVTSFWFLWAVLWACVSVCLTYKLGKNKWYWYVILICVTFITPDMLNSECYKFMYLCFLVGFWSYTKREVIQKIPTRYVLIGSAILYLLLLPFYETTSFIYTSGWSIIHDIKIIVIDIYRCAIGIVGSVFVIEIFKVCENHIPTKIKILLMDIGKCTMGIYILSTYANSVLLKVTRNREYNLLLIILETILIILVSYVGTKLLGKNKYTAKMFLGGRSVR